MSKYKLKRSLDTTQIIVALIGLAGAVVACFGVIVPLMTPKTSDVLIALTADALKATDSANAMFNQTATAKSYTPTLQLASLTPLPTDTPLAPTSTSTASATVTPVPPTFTSTATETLTSTLTQTIEPQASPTPLPTFTPQPTIPIIIPTENKECTAVIKTEGLAQEVYMRTQPNAGTKIQISVNTNVSVLDRRLVSGGLWYKLADEKGKFIGWIASDYLKLTTTCSI